MKNCIVKLNQKEVAAVSGGCTELIIVAAVGGAILGFIYGCCFSDGIRSRRRPIEPVNPVNIVVVNGPPAVARELVDISLT